MGSLTKSQKDEYKRKIRYYIYRFFSIIFYAKKYEKELNENGQKLINGFELYNENLKDILNKILKDANENKLIELRNECEILKENFQIRKPIDQIIQSVSDSIENDNEFINLVCADAIKGFGSYKDIFYKDKEISIDLQSLSREEKDEIINVDWSIWKLNEKKEYEPFDGFISEDSISSIKISQTGDYKIVANIFSRKNDGEIPELKERKSVLVHVVNEKSNLINKTKDGKYEIIYDKDNTNVYYLDKNVITNEITEIKQNDDMYRKLSTALGIEKKITNEELKEQMLDNEYCFVNNVGWIKQQDYNEHREGKKEKEELSSIYEYGIFKRLQKAIENHDKKAFEALPNDKFNNYDDWIKLIEDDNTQLSNFKLRAKYITNHLYLYYFNSAKTEVYAEILDIDALSSVTPRNYPTIKGDNSPNKAEGITTNDKKETHYYIPVVFPSGTWNINKIEETPAYFEEFGPYKIRTDAHTMVNEWIFKKIVKNGESHWIQNGKQVKDDGYLIHGGDGSNNNKTLFNTIDKSKGNNRYDTTTRGCIRINNKDVYLLKEILEKYIPIKLEV